MTRLAANSFQQDTNAKTVAVTMPGHTSGSETRVRICQRLSPSSCAASSTSIGIPAKKLCRIHTANDRLKAAFTRIMASQVSLMPSTKNSRINPVTSTVGCNIWVTSTSPRNSARPGNRRRAV